MSATIVVIACGPSLTARDVAFCKGRARVLAVNDAFRIAMFADWLYACDGQWWRATAIGETAPNHELSRAMMRPHAPRITRDRDAARAFDLHHIESRAMPGLSRDPMVIHEGENSGYQAINLAFLFGARRIVLLGFDMQGRGHWFGEHPRDITNMPNFGMYTRHFGRLALDLESEGVEVINASRTTGLQCFRRATIDEALA